jgi:hypothetical protein
MACRSVRLKVKTALVLEQLLGAEGAHGRPFTTAGCRNVSLFHPSLAASVPRGQAPFLSLSLLPPLSRSALVSSASLMDGWARDPFLSLLTERAVRAAGVSRPPRPDPETPCAPSSVPDAVICAILATGINSRRMLSNRLDAGFVDELTPTESACGWSIHASDSIMQEDQAFARITPPAPTMYALIRGLKGEIDSRLEHRFTSHQSINSCFYWSPSTLILHSLLQQFWKDQASVSTPDAEFLVAAVYRFWLHANDPDAYTLFSDPEHATILQQRQAAAKPPAGPGSSDAASSSTDAAAAASADSQGGSKAHHVSFEDESADDTDGRSLLVGGTKFQARALRGVASVVGRSGMSRNSYVPLSKDLVLGVNVLGLHVTSGGALQAACTLAFEAAQGKRPDALVDWRPAPAAARFMFSKHELAGLTPLASPQFNVHTPLSMPPLYRALLPGVFDFFRIHIRSCVADLSASPGARFPSLVGAWVTWITPWRSRRRAIGAGTSPASSLFPPSRDVLALDVSFSATSRCLDEARLGISNSGIQVTSRSVWLKLFRSYALALAMLRRSFESLPNEARMLLSMVATAFRLLNPHGAFLAIERLVHLARRLPAHSSELESRWPLWKLQVTPNDDGENDQDPVVSQRRRLVCDGRGCLWAAERAALFSDFPSVHLRGRAQWRADVEQEVPGKEIRGEDHSFVSPEGVLTRFVIADEVQRSTTSGECAQSLLVQWWFQHAVQVLISQCGTSTPIGSRTWLTPSTSTSTRCSA